MHSAFLPFKSSRLHYSHSDTGDHMLLCFHGYGESAHTFHFLENYLPASCFIVAIDMPYHGLTEWKEKMKFSREDLLHIINTIRSRHEFTEKPLSLLGYSMGGRIALSLLESSYDPVNKVVLLAPDGIKLNFWYWFATQTSIGNKVFAATIRHPDWFLGMVKLLNKVGLLNQSIYKFVDYFLHDEQKRKLLYLRWTCLRKLKPDHKTIKAGIRKHKIPVHLVYGKHDRIILPSRGEKFRQGIENYCSIDIIESGHQLLQEKNISALIKYLS